MSTGEVGILQSQHADHPDLCPFGYLAGLPAKAICCHAGAGSGLLNPQYAMRQEDRMMRGDSGGAFQTVHVRSRQFVAPNPPSV
jgi:hypothetical protein